MSVKVVLYWIIFIIFRQAWVISHRWVHRWVIVIVSVTVWRLWNVVHFRAPWIVCNMSPSAVKQNCLPDSWKQCRNCICPGSRSEIVGTFGRTRSTGSAYTVFTAWKRTSWCGVDEEGEFSSFVIVKGAFFVYSCYFISAVRFRAADIND